MVNYIADFFSFYLVRPFKSPLGIIAMICLAIYIYLRVSGKIEGPRLGRGRDQGRQGPDYIIK